MKYRATLVCVLLLGTVSLPMAQERGQYVPGTAGLNSGIQAPEGFTFANIFIWYPSTKFKDQDGKTAPINFHLDLLADFNLFALGGEFGVILPTRKFNFLIRVLPEFGARNRTQGVTMVVGVAKSS